MFTRSIMTASAAALGILGIILSFAPAEVSQLIGSDNGGAIAFQILGAAYFGFAMINWTSRGNLIGGIYNRPVAIGNLAHFVIGALALAKLVIHQQTPLLLIGAAVYVLFALMFAIIFFRHPLPASR